MNILISITIILFLNSAVLSENEVQNRNQVLEILCKFFPEAFQSQCSAFFNKNINDDMQIHTEIELGMSKEKEQIQNFYGRCKKCINIVKTFERFINTSLTANIIQQQLVNVCQIITSPKKERIINFLKKEGPKIIPRILKKDNPKKICQMENMCIRIEELVEIEEKEPSISDTLDLSKYCTTCESVSKTLENVQNKNLSKTQILKVLDSACYFVQTTQIKECTKFISNFNEKIAEILVEDSKPISICSSLSVCPVEKNISDKFFFLPMMKLQ